MFLIANKIVYVRKFMSIGETMHWGVCLVTFANGAADFIARFVLVDGLVFIREYAFSSKKRVSALWRLLPKSTGPSIKSFVGGPYKTDCNLKTTLKEDWKLCRKTIFLAKQHWAFCFINIRGEKSRLNEFCIPKLPNYLYNWMTV